MKGADGVEETEKEEKVGEEEDIDVGTDTNGSAEGRGGGDGWEEVNGKEEVECNEEDCDCEDIVDGESVNELSNEENGGTLDTVSTPTPSSHCGPLPVTELMLPSPLDPVPCTSPRSIGSWL